MYPTTDTIKYFIRDFIVFFCSYLGVAWAYRTSVRRSGPLVRIVVFHDVHDEVWFDTLIRTLVGHYHMLTPQTFSEKKFNPEAINVLLTFDDGYESWETHALPILLKYGVTGLFFVNSGLIDVAGDQSQSAQFMKERLMLTPRTPITWSGVRALLQSGHAIGSHARHHLNLARLSKEEVTHELVEDKVRIESMLGTHVTECAYPFGTNHHVNPMVLSVAREVGFERGYTAISRSVGSSETFAIPRMCIESDSTPFRLRQWIEGGYDMFDTVKSLCVR